MRAAPRERAPRGGEETRARILDVALDLFSELGFAGTPVRAIADACRLSDAALYYHFSSKRAILLALWERDRQPAEGYPEPGTPLTEPGLMRLVEVTLDGAAAQDRLLRTVTQQALDGDTLAIALRDDMEAQWRNNILELLLPGREPADAQHIADFLVTLMTGVVVSSQIDQQRGFPSLCTQEAFRERIKQVVKACEPLADC